MELLKFHWNNRFHCIQIHWERDKLNDNAKRLHKRNSFASSPNVFTSPQTFAGDMKCMIYWLIEWIVFFLFFFYLVCWFHSHSINEYEINEAKLYPRVTGSLISKSQNPVFWRKSFNFLHGHFFFYCVMNSKATQILCVLLTCMCRTATMIIQSSYNLSTKHSDGHIGF